MAPRPGPSPQWQPRPGRAAPIDNGSPRHLWRVVPVPAHVIPARRVRCDARAEALPGAAALRSPPHFSNRRHPWQSKVHHRANVADGLTPNRRFDTDDVALTHTLYICGRIPIVRITHFHVRRPV